MLGVLWIKLDGFYKVIMGGTRDTKDLYVNTLHSAPVASDYMLNIS